MAKKSPRKSSSRKKIGTPSVKASTLSITTRRKGRDGTFYKVSVRSNGVHYWAKCGGNVHCGTYGLGRNKEGPAPKGYGSGWH